MRRTRISLEISSNRFMDQYSFCRDISLGDDINILFSFKKSNYIFFVVMGVDCFNNLYYSLYRFLFCITSQDKESAERRCFFEIGCDSFFCGGNLALKRLHSNGRDRHQELGANIECAQ